MTERRPRTRSQGAYTPPHRRQAEGQDHCASRSLDELQSNYLEARTAGHPESDPLYQYLSLVALTGSSQALPSHRGVPIRSPLPAGDAHVFSGMSLYQQAEQPLPFNWPCVRLLHIFSRDLHM